MLVVTSASQYPYAGEVANELANDLVKDGEDKVVLFDPMFIIAIIGIIINLVKLWKDCNKTPLNALADSKSPGLIGRWQLRRLIKHSLDDEEVSSRYGNKVFKAVLAKGQKLTEDNLKKLFTEV